MTTTSKAARKQAQPELPDAFYRITSLLHTMRTIAQHEDRLCLLRNEIKRTQAVGPRLMKELKALLEELPAEEYTGDLHAVEAALASATSRKVKSAAKKSAKRSVPNEAPSKGAKRPA